MIIGAGQVGDLLCDLPCCRREGVFLEQSSQRTVDVACAPLVLLEGETGTGAGQGVSVVPHVRPHRHAELRQAALGPSEQ